MEKFDTSKIKANTNSKIAYINYEREETMKKTKFKNFAFVLGIITLILGTTVTVDAMTGNAISNQIKESIVNIIIDDEEYTSDCKTQNDNSITCKIIEKSN